MSILLFFVLHGHQLLSQQILSFLILLQKTKWGEVDKWGEVNRN